MTMKLKKTRELSNVPYGHIPPAPISSTPTLAKVIDMAKATVLDPSKLAQLDADILAQQAIHDDLFDIEVDAKRKAGAHLSKLKDERKMLGKAEKFAGRYVPISHEVLKWRDDKKLPKL